MRTKAMAGAAGVIAMLGAFGCDAEGLPLNASPSVARAVQDDGGGEPDAARALDAGFDAGAAGPDAGASDAGDDAGRAGDAAADAGGGACSLVTQDCPASLTCRRTDTSPSTLPRSGPTDCLSFGSLNDGNWGASPGTSCSPGDCGRGLFCQSYGTCRRFCDPAGDPCPDTPWGAPQSCITDGIGIDPYCSPGSV